ncbi:MAG: hypothetical protein WCA24_04770 [Thiomonas sp.]
MSECYAAVVQTSDSKMVAPTTLGAISVWNTRQVKQMILAARISGPGIRPAKAQRGQIDEYSAHVLPICNAQAWQQLQTVKPCRDQLIVIVNVAQ